jgi:hypothetical protein
MSSAFDTHRAERYAALALGCIEREFPSLPAHVMRDANDLRRPRDLHPAFYGCYDWHSAVHGHWVLAHIRKRFPGFSMAGAIGAALSRNLSTQNLRAEAAYLAAHPGFERPYGWAWLLKLANELLESGDADAERWLAALQPLLEAVEAHYLAWLPKQTYPIRSGTHTNTAFGLSFALDYAEGARKVELKELVVRRAKDYFAADRDYPAAWEPGGNDFFSPCLVEADLMQRVLFDFPEWFSSYLRDIPESLLHPVTVSDRADGQLAHLDGLNLSRAWCFFRLAESLPEKKPLLRDAGHRHLAAGLQHIESGHYAGEHWLATFAAYALACALEGATTTPAARNAAT